jgi:DNA-binding transcriptional LysR family regulator
MTRFVTRRSPSVETRVKHAALAGAFRLNGGQRVQSQFRGSNETIKQAVMAGLGIALISAHTVAAEIADGRPVCLDVEGLPIVRQWYVVNRSDRALSPAARAFREFVTERGSAFLPGLG